MLPLPKASYSGTANPCSCKSLAAVNAAWTAGGASVGCCNWCKRVSACCGIWLWTGRISAHEAQCTGVAVTLAEVSPNPPWFNGKCAMASEVALSNLPQLQLFHEFNIIAPHALFFPKVTMGCLELLLE